MQQTTNRREVNAIRAHFWTRLEELLTDAGYKKVEEQSSYLGIAKNTLMNWKQWKCSPGYDVLLRIADKFGCSVDYLIDERVKVKTASADTQTAVKTTGLSEPAVDALRACQECGADELLNVINALILSDIAVNPDPESLKAGFPVQIGQHGSVQGSGLIGALNQNMKTAIAYATVKAGQDKSSSDNLTEDELRQWFDDKRKVESVKTRFENTGYKMMLICTTATAEGEKYHESLRQKYAEYQCINDQKL